MRANTRERQLAALTSMLDAEGTGVAVLMARDTMFAAKAFARTAERPLRPQLLAA